MSNHGRGNSITGQDWMTDEESVRGFALPFYDLRARCALLYCFPMSLRWCCFLCHRISTYSHCVHCDWFSFVSIRRISEDKNAANQRRWSIPLKLKRFVGYLCSHRPLFFIDCDFAVFYWLCFGYLGSTKTRGTSSETCQEGVGQTSQSLQRWKCTER